MKNNTKKKIVSSIASIFTACVLMTSCNSSNNESSSVKSEQLFKQDLDMNCGINKITIPKNLSSDGKAKIKFVIRDLNSRDSFVLDLVEFNDKSECDCDKIKIEIVEKGYFLSNLESGVNNLHIKGSVFPDGKNRKFTILKQQYDFSVLGTKIEKDPIPKVQQSPCK